MYEKGIEIWDAALCLTLVVFWSALKIDTMLFAEQKQLPVSVENPNAKDKKKSDART